MEMPATVQEFLRDHSPKNSPNGVLLGYWLDTNEDYNVLAVFLKESEFRFSISTFPQVVAAWGHQLNGGELGFEEIERYFPNWNPDEAAKETLRRVIQSIKNGARSLDDLNIERGGELIKIYEESGTVRNGTSIKPFAEAILPLLQVYGVASDSPEVELFQNRVYGSAQGSRIEMQYSGGYVDPYTGGSSSQTLESFQLVHAISGAKLKVEITIEDVIWSHTEIKLRFEGETSEIEKLKKAIEPVLKQALQSKPSYSPRSLPSKIDSDSDLKELEKEASLSQTPPARLIELSKHPRYFIRDKVAGNSSAPLSLLKSLAADPDMDVREAVAENRNTPPETLTALAKDARRYVRRKVARNPKTPPVTLESLATDADDEVRKKVAGNPTTPAFVLEAFATNSNFQMRAIVANNRNAPISLLEALARDEHLYVRLEVARNPSIPAWLYKSLAKEVEQADDAD